MEHSVALFQKIAVTHSLGVIFILQEASFLFPRCSGAHFPFIKHAGRHGEGPPAFHHRELLKVQRCHVIVIRLSEDVDSEYTPAEVAVRPPTPTPTPRPSRHCCCVPHCAL